MAGLTLDWSHSFLFMLKHRLYGNRNTINTKCKAYKAIIQAITRVNRWNWCVASALLKPYSSSSQSWSPDLYFMPYWDKAAGRPNPQRPCCSPFEQRRASFLWISPLKYRQGCYVIKLFLKFWFWLCVRIMLFNCLDTADR